VVRCLSAFGGLRFWGGALYSKPSSLKGGNAMCDYSLAHFPNRLAVEGEQLLVYPFSSGTRGFTSQCPNLEEILSHTQPTAVCVPPGSRLLLHDIPEYLQQNLGVDAAEEVTFIQQTLEAFTHRDAVRFSNGREILLQYLRSGQRVDVLSLSPRDDRNLDHRTMEEQNRQVLVS
jgi:hypothetical protein